MKKAAAILAITLVATGCLNTESLTGDTAATTAPAGESEASHNGNPAAAKLNSLKVAEEAEYRQGYDRDLFPHWEDTNGSGCSAREDMVKEAVLGLPQIDIYSPCKVIEGDFWSVYDNVSYSGHPSAFDLDHVVALAEAWDSGADQWDRETRRAFANDPENLILVTASSNREKSADDAAEWVPSNNTVHCAFATTIIDVKAKYNLSIDSAEKAALGNLLQSC